MPDKIAVVFGASGFLGRHVVRELAARGWRVRGAVRRPGEAQFLRPLGSKVGQVDVVQANIRYRASIAQAMSGADAVVNLVGILQKAGKQNFDNVQSQGARNVAEMAAAAGIENVVHVSAIGADPEGESDYARTKAEGEAAMREFCPTATILRPSIVFGPQDDFFNKFAAMARTSPVLPLIGGGKTKFQPVYVDDVADAVAMALEDEKYRGRTFELGGPRVLTFKECLELMLKVTGRKRILAPLPFFAATGIGQASAPMAWVGMTPPITADQVKLLKTDNVVGDSGEEDIGTFEDFGISPEPLEAILPTYLVRFREKGQFSPESAV